MKRTEPARRLARFGLGLALGLLLLARSAPALAVANPDFDAVTWIPIGCDNPDLIFHTSPATAEFVGNGASPAAYYAYDDGFLYFRYRMDTDPSGAGGFAQVVWTALMQVPSGNPFQYQYQLSLNGKDDTIEVWANTVASNIAFTPLFHDDSEVKLFSQSYAATSAFNSSPLARRVASGTAFGGTADYFLDFAFPVGVLVNNGIIAGAGDLAFSSFFPATATNPNNYNKGHLNCSFLPGASLSLEKSVDPAVVPANTDTPVTFTIDVHNDGTIPGKGIVVDDIALPAYLSGAAADVTSDDPGAMWTVVSVNPLHVLVTGLAGGKTVSIALSALAHPTCASADFMNHATAFATNAMAMSAQALLDVQTQNGFDACDGVDNDCDGLVDEDGATDCNDGNVCNGAETCGGASGCHAGTPITCDDGNACTVDTCDPQAGCVATPLPGCVPCSTDGDCTDGNACTTDSCVAGVCGSAVIPGCIPCEADGDCQDGNACTADSCVAGACSSAPIPGCVPCDTPADCNDQNACTTETCTAGVCGHSPVEGCVPCDTPADCNDQNACTTETCTAGVCGHDTIESCQPCETPADCNDQNGCTTESCTEGVCGHDTIPGCVPCETAADCGDQSACTTDVCTEAGTCDHETVPGCIPCATDGDCADGNACTLNTCGEDQSCQVTEIPGCRPCTTAADCDDEDVCTTDTCVAGACVETPVQGCPAEICTDGVDNDGDGLVDCDDTDCQGDPSCLQPEQPAEICDDCIDNDGDGLVDSEDPDCCWKNMDMNLKRLLLKPGAVSVKGNRLRLKSIVPFTVDPRASGLKVQISDAEGQILCQYVGGERWKGRKRSFKFRDKTGALGGLKRGKLKLKKNQTEVFRTKGKKMDLRSPVGSSVRVTVALGDSCSSATVPLKTKKTRLVFP